MEWRLAARSEPEALRRGFFVAGVLLALVVCFVPAVFGTIDDFEMIRIVKGLDGFPADSDTLYLSRVLSECLSTLYQWWPGFPWYGVLLYLTAWLGAGLLFSVALMPCVDPRRAAIYLPAAAALVLHCYWYPTFTASTLLLEFGVLLYLIARLVAGQAGPSRGVLLTAGLVLAYLWRWDLMLYGLILGLPLLLYASRRHLLKALPYALVFVAVVVLDRTWSHWATDTPEYHRFREFAGLRSRFHDSPDGLAGPNTQAALAAAGWAGEDYVLFRSRWGIHDNRVFHPESVRRFLAENSRGGAAQFLRQAAKCALYGLYENLLILPVFAFTLAALLLQPPPVSQRLSRRARLKRLLVIGALAGPLVLLAPYRFVARVTVPLMLCLLGALMVLREKSVVQRAPESEPEDETRPSIRGMLAQIALACAVLACFWQCLIQVVGLKQQTAETQHAWQCLQRVQQTDDGPHLFVRLDALGTGLGFNRVHPLWGPCHHEPVRTVTGIWKTMSPRYVQILQELGCRDGRQFLRRVVTDDHILLSTYFHGPEDELTARLWELYFNRHLSDAAEGGAGPLRLQPVFDFRSPDGIGPVYYRVASAEPQTAAESDQPPQNQTADIPNTRRSNG